MQFIFLQANTGLAAPVIRGTSINVDGVLGFGKLGASDTEMEVSDLIGKQFCLPSYKIFGFTN
jgi:hypothetical protein